MTFYNLLENQETTLKLHKCFYYNTKLFHEILNHFTTLEEVIANLNKLTFKNSTNHIQKLKTLSIKKELNYIQKENINLLTLNHPNYPHLLKEIAFPPPLLFTKGNLKCLFKPTLAVVGPRYPSPYGKQITRFFSKDLCKHMCIVSGFATGIDTLAHKICIENKTETIAVMGTGLDTYYPKNNAHLAQEILNNNGLLVSEIPLFSKPEKFHFPLRNNTISGLSRGVLITEAKEKSGSLITAHLALEQNRDIFAIPANILTPHSKGVNELIKQGALCCTSPTDILNEFNMLEQSSNNKTTIQYKEHTTSTLTTNEQTILNLLTKPKHIEELISESKLTIQDILHSLTFLEIKQHVKKATNNTYSCI